MADLSKIKNLLNLNFPEEQFDMTAPENLSEPIAVEQPKAVSIPKKIQPKVEEIPNPYEGKMNELDNEDFGQDEEQEIQPASLQQPTPEKPKIASILEELQKARDEQNRSLNMLQAGNLIAKGVASGYGANIGDGSELVNTLRTQAEQPIKDYSARIENEENDPNSDISKFMRENAYQVLSRINPEKKYDLENMTANQLKKALGSKLLGGQQSSKSNNRYVTTQEPDGTVRSKLIDMETGETIKDLGLAGYAYGVQIDPVTGQLTRVSKSDPSVRAINPAVGQPVGPDGKKAEVKSVGDYRKSEVITPKEWDKVVTVDKEGFERQNGDKLKIISSLKGVESLVDEATKNPNAAAALGGIIGSFFEPGKLTDEDAKRYVQEAGIVNKIKDWVSLTAKGTIRPALAAEIKKTAKSYYEQMDKIVRSNAEKYSNATKASLINGDQIDNKILADFYYQTDNVSQAPDMVKIQTPSGSVMRIPREKLEQAKSKGAKEIK